MLTLGVWGRRLFVGLAGLGLAGTLAAQGLAPVGRGWVAEDGSNPQGFGYIAGNCPGCSLINYHNWFVFDLSCATEPITSAYLVLEMPTDGFWSVDPFETYTLFDVTTPLADLMSSQNDTAYYVDLGTGTSYGSVAVSESDEGGEVIVPLNAAGLAALNAALGGQVGIGGAITTLDADPGTGERAFRYSTNWAVRLVIEPGCAVRDAFDRGWYNENGDHTTTNVYYSVGNWPSGLEVRNFFVFDMEDVGAPISSATLALEHPYGHVSPDPSETYTLFEVSTPIAELLDASAGLAAFQDLGQGTEYGSQEVTAASGYSLVTVSLNEDGLAALNAMAVEGGQIALGGAFTTLDADPLTSEFSFGAASPVHCISQLVLEVEAQWSFLGAGLAGTGGQVPLLTGTGSLVGGTTATLTLSNALPNTTATLVIGLAQLNAPFKGGLLVPSPDVLVFGLPTGPAGTLALSATWPALPSGLTIVFQHWIADPAGPVGFSASNGLQSVTP
jgi:hypothetical protein